MKLRELNMIGMAYYHVFSMLDGTEVEERCTEEEYRALALPDAGQPIKFNGKWLRSVEVPLYDSESGKLEKGCFATNGARHYLVHIDGKRISTVPRSRITEKDMPDQEISKLDPWR